MHIKTEKIISLIHNVRFGGLPTHYPSIAAWEGAGASGPEVLRAWKVCAKKIGDRPLGIYLNVPFCRSKCGFCFLDIVPAGPGWQHDTGLFLSAIESEIRLLSGPVAGRVVSSVYIGGGTPNTLSAGQLARLLSTLGGSFRILPGTQISMEANPDLFDRDKLSALAAGGVSMLMLGIQSFSPAVNAANGRRQDVSRIEKVFAMIRSAGIPAVNADLLCGLNAQTRKSFLDDVARLAALGPSQIHLNRIKPLSGVLAPERKAKLAQWQAEGLRLLERRGYTALDEESACLGGTRNLQGDYRFQLESSLLGLGPGALSHAWGLMRYQNLTGLTAWAECALAGRTPVMRGLRIGPADELRHYLMNELLHGTPVSAASVATRFGAAGRALLLPLAARLLKAGALKRRGKAYICPLEGEDWLKVTAALYPAKYLRSIARRYSIT